MAKYVRHETMAHMSNLTALILDDRCLEVTTHELVAKSSFPSSSLRKTEKPTKQFLVDCGKCRQGESML